MNIVKNIVFAGAAGEGIETAGKITAKILHNLGYHTFFLPEYMSRIKGGCNSSLLKVSENFAPYFEKRIDVLICIDKCAIEHLKARVSKETRIIELPQGAGNFWAIGVVLGMFKVEFERAKELIGEILNFKNNLEQLKEGLAFEVETVEAATGNVPGQLISCNDAVALGCLKGGCNFISFYPMSPSTALSTFMCGQEGVIAEQVEDEICAINMAIGASYAGARAMVSTSGGGFALMCEGVSLAGISETPVVIHLAQRPGPATGLPTRDAQEDLNLALYAGHGEFPRIILSPSTIKNSYEIAAKAFNLADKFQVPVFILTQQSFLESEFEAQPFDDFEALSHIVESADDYKRYCLNCGVISPRAIPNFGKGVVCVDSDEHDEYGRITEDLEMRKKMTDKRMAKLDLIKQELDNDPAGFDFSGPESGNLAISWGGNYHVIQAAIKDRTDFAHLHIKQLYPIQGRVFEYIKNAKTVSVIEQNATGQLAALLGLQAHKKLLKYSGEPFALEEIREWLNEF